MMDSLAGMLVRSARMCGGGTFDPYTGESPTRGYVVGGLAPSLVLDNTLSAHVLAEQVRPLVRMACNSGDMVGSWLHDGQIHFDVVAVESDLDVALALARANSEIAIFDLSTHTEIYL